KTEPGRDRSLLALCQPPEPAQDVLLVFLQIAFAADHQSPSASILASSSAASTGLITQSLAPWRSAHSRSVACSLPVHMTTGICAVSGFFDSARVAWKPLRPGMTTSMST